MARAVNFRVGRGRASERRKASSARGLLAAMNVINLAEEHGYEIVHDFCHVGVVRRRK
jgi:hypothetical protein